MACGCQRSPQILFIGWGLPGRRPPAPLQAEQAPMPNRSMCRRSDFCRAPHVWRFLASTQQCIRPKTVTAFASLNASVCLVSRVPSRNYCPQVQPRLLHAAWTQAPTVRPHCSASDCYLRS